MPSFCGVILAAGASSRMGRDKALLAWRGTTFLQSHIDLLKQYSELVIVVAGKNAPNLRSLVDAAAGYLVTNPDPDRGQFSSLRVGLQEVLNRGRDGAIIALVDRPAAGSETMVHLRSEFDRAETAGKWVVVPEYSGRHGHPIIFNRNMIEACLRAPSSATARELEHAHQDRIQYVPVQDPLVVLNVDTPEDYEKLKGT